MAAGANVRAKHLMVELKSVAVAGHEAALIIDDELFSGMWSLEHMQRHGEQGARAAQAHRGQRLDRHEPHRAQGHAREQREARSAAAAGGC